MAGYVVGLPNEKSLRIGKNIEFLRKRNNNETQFSLARAIGKSHQYISTVENGKRHVLKEDLAKIARYYDVTVELVENEVLTEEKIRKLNTIKFDDSSQSLNFLFMTWKTPQPTQDEDFNRGLELWNKFLQDGGIHPYMLRPCRERFYNSYKNGNILAGAANTLRLLVLEYTFMGVRKEYLEKENLTEQDQTNLFVEMVSSRKLMSDKKKKFIEDTTDMFDECLKALRNSRNTLDIYELFFALRLYFQMEVCDDEEFGESITITGFNLLWKFSELGNKYCKSYLEYIINFIDVNEESVDKLIEGVE